MHNDKYIETTERKIVSGKDGIFKKYIYLGHRKKVDSKR